MKVKDFLLNQARKAGVTLPDGVLDNVPEYEVPDEVAKGIDNSLISITDAKNNHSEIKNHYQKQTLDSFDKLLGRQLEANPELAEDEDLKTERSTYKRAEMMYDKIASLQAKKANADGGKAKGEIQKQIDDLHAQLRQVNEARAADKANHDKALTDYKKKAELRQLLRSHKTIHDELPDDVRATILETLINKELQDNGVDFAFDASGRLALLKGDGSNYFGENHQQILPGDFIEKTLAKTKQLKLSNGQPAQQQNQNGQQQTKGIDAGGKPNPNASLIASNLAAIENYNKSSAANAQMMK